MLLGNNESRSGENDFPRFRHIPTPFPHYGKKWLLWGGISLLLFVDKHVIVMKYIVVVAMKHKLSGSN